MQKDEKGAELQRDTNSIVFQFADSLSDDAVSESVVPHVLFLSGDNQSCLSGVIIFLECHVQAVDVVGVFRDPICLPDEKIDELVGQVLVLTLADDFNRRIDLSVPALYEELQSSLILSAEGVEPREENEMRREELNSPLTVQPFQNLELSRRNAPL